MPEQATAPFSQPTETIAIMQVRYGTECAGSFEAVNGYGEASNDQRRRGSLSSPPATSSALPRSCSNGGQSVSSSPATISAHFDPTCAPFEPVTCDVFITEATFALPGIPARAG